MLETSSDLSNLLNTDLLKLAYAYLMSTPPNKGSKPLIPNKASEDDRPEPSEYETEDRRIADLKANKPPHHG